MLFCNTTQCHRCLRFWGSMQVPCWLQECPPELLQENWMFILSTISHLQCRFTEFGSTSNQPHNRRPRVLHRVGELFADINIVNRVLHGGGGVMVWAGISYRQWTQLHFIDGNLYAQRSRDEILMLIIIQLICRHHLMFQHDNARPHVPRICTQFLEAENVAVHPWPAYSPDVRFSGSTCKTAFPAISSNFAQPLKWLIPQSTAWSTLCEWDVSRYMRQMVFTPDTD